MKRKLTPKIIEEIESITIFMLLHSAQDQLAKGKYIWNIFDPYYGEAFGIMRAMETLNYCYSGADNLPEEKENLKWWFNQCKDKAEEIITRLGVNNAIAVYQALVIAMEKRNKKAFKQ